MKFASSLFCALVLGLAAPAAADDRAALDKLGKDFAMGFWNKNPAEVLATVHPDISKKGVAPNFRGSGEAVMETLPPDRLQILGRVYNSDDRLQAIEGPRVNIHEIDGDVASIEMVNGEWYDFFHAVKLNGEWTLLNCVYGGMDTYESAQPDADRAAVENVLEAYVAGLAGASEALETALHVNLERRKFGESRGGKQYVKPLAREALILDAGAHGVEADKTQIAIHKITDRVAAARIDFGEWTEQIQLMKINGGWSIVNSFVY